MGKQGQKQATPGVSPGRQVERAVKPKEQEPEMNPEMNLETREKAFQELDLGEYLNDGSAFLTDYKQPGGE